MPNPNILLSICVPTYNRHRALDRQLSCLVEASASHEDVEIIVSDNASSDETPDVCEHWIPHGIRVNRNISNHGLVGNLRVLAGLARGRFIWFVGDDDDLEPWLIDRVISTLRDDDPKFAFINHRIRHTVLGPLHESVINPKGGHSLECGADLIRELGSVFLMQLMFITACIHRRDRIADYIDRNVSLAAPFYYSLRSLSGDGRVSVIRDVGMTNNWGETSWEHSALELSAKMVPAVLIDMVGMDYPILLKMTVVREYLSRNVRTLLRYWAPPVFLMAQKLRQALK